MEPLLNPEEFRKAGRSWMLSSLVLWGFFFLICIILLGLVVGDGFSDFIGPTATRTVWELLAGFVLFIGLISMLLNLAVRSRRFGRVLRQAARQDGPQFQLVGELAGKQHQTMSSRYGTQHMWTSYRVVVPTATGTVRLQAKGMMRPDRNSRHGDRVLLQLYGHHGMVGGALQNARTNAVFPLKVRIPRATPLEEMVTASMLADGLPSPPGDVGETRPPESAVASASRQVPSHIVPLAEVEQLQRVADDLRGNAVALAWTVGASWLLICALAIVAANMDRGPTGVGFPPPFVVVMVLTVVVLVTLCWSLIALLARREPHQSWRDIPAQHLPDYQADLRVVNRRGIPDFLRFGLHHTRYGLAGEAPVSDLTIRTYRKYRVDLQHGDVVRVQWFHSDEEWTAGVVRLSQNGDVVPVTVQGAGVLSTHGRN